LEATVALQMYGPFGVNYVSVCMYSNFFWIWTTYSK